MKRILVIIGSFAIGGSRSSLYSLLSVLDAQKVQVDVFARERIGPLMEIMPNCRILPENIWLSHHIYEGSRLQKWLSMVLYFLRGSLQRLGLDLFKLYNSIGGKQIKSDAYDAVIGFDEMQARYISYLPAKKRIVWLHCDYRRFINGHDEAKYYERIDHVVCVSRFAKEAFLSVLPQFEPKVVIIRNAINVEDIVAKSKLVTPEVECYFPHDYEKTFTIISIGRLDPVKQFEKIPAIVADVKRRLDGKLSFQWLIIGGGDADVKRMIEKEIETYHVNGEVHLLGAQTNPYPYLAKSDLNVCTSSNETFSYTIHEGLALQVPFLCNDFQGASDSVHGGQEGYIMPLAEMPAIIAKLINSPMHIGACTISNDELLSKLYNLV